MGSGGRNESNGHLFVPTSEMKTFRELEVHHVQKVEIKRFWAQEAEMSLKATSVFSKQDENFSWTRRTLCLENRNKTFLDSGGRNESNNHQLAGIGEEEIFHELDRTIFLESRIQTFFGSGGRNESTSLKPARIGGKKIFHELDVHHV